MLSEGDYAWIWISLVVDGGDDVAFDGWLMGLVLPGYAVEDGVVRWNESCMR